MTHGVAYSDIIFELHGTRICINCHAYENHGKATGLSSTYEFEAKTIARSSRLNLPSSFPPLPSTIKALPTLNTLIYDRRCARLQGESALGHLDKPNGPLTKFPAGEDRQFHQSDKQIAVPSAPSNSHIKSACAVSGSSVALQAVRNPVDTWTTLTGVDAVLITSPDGLLGLPALIKQHRETCAFIPPPKVFATELTLRIARLQMRELLSIQLDECRITSERLDHTQQQRQSYCPFSEQDAVDALSLVTGLRLGERAATGTGAFVSPFSCGASMGACSWHITCDPSYRPSVKPYSSTLDPKPHDIALHSPSPTALSQRVPPLDTARLSVGAAVDTTVPASPFRDRGMQVGSEGGSVQAAHAAQAAQAAHGAQASQGPQGAQVSTTAPAVGHSSAVQRSLQAVRAVEQVAVIAAPGPSDTMAMPAQWEPVRDCHVAILCHGGSGWEEGTVAEGRPVDEAAGGAAGGSGGVGIVRGGGEAREEAMCSRGGERKGEEGANSGKEGDEEEGVLVAGIVDLILQHLEGGRARGGGAGEGKREGGRQQKQQQQQKDEIRRKRQRENGAGAVKQATLRHTSGGGGGGARRDCTKSAMKEDERHDAGGFRANDEENEGGEEGKERRGECHRVLIPCYSLLGPSAAIDVMEQLLGRMSEREASRQTPILYLSSVACDAIALSSVVPEWLAPHCQNKLFAGQPMHAIAAAVHHSSKASRLTAERDAGRAVSRQMQQQQQAGSASMRPDSSSGRKQGVQSAAPSSSLSPPCFEVLQSSQGCLFMPARRTEVNEGQAGEEEGGGEEQHGGGIGILGGRATWQTSEGKSGCMGVDGGKGVWLSTSTWNAAVRRALGGPCIVFASHDGYMRGGAAVHLLNQWKHDKLALLLLLEGPRSAVPPSSLLTLQRPTSEPSRRIKVVHHDMRPKFRSSLLKTLKLLTLHAPSLRHVVCDLCESHDTGVGGPSHAQQPPHPPTNHPSDPPFTVHHLHRGPMTASDAANRINRAIGAQGGFTILPPVVPQISGAAVGPMSCPHTLHSKDRRGGNASGDSEVEELIEGGISCSLEGGSPPVASAAITVAAATAATAATAAVPAAIAMIAAAAAGDEAVSAPTVPAMMSRGLLRAFKRAEDRQHAAGRSEECQVAFSDGIWTVAEA